MASAVRIAYDAPERPRRPGRTAGRRAGWSSGWLGTARAAGLVGRCTGDGALVEAGRRLAGRAVQTLARTPTLVPGLSRPARRLGRAPDRGAGRRPHPADEPTRRTAATALLQRLIPYAGDHPTIPDSPVSWPMAGTGPAVIGLAHGGSGITIALAGARAAGLAAADSLDHLITGTLRWEDGHFRPEAGGWPDLRSDGRRAGPRLVPRRTGGGHRGRLSHPRRSPAGAELTFSPGQPDGARVRPADRLRTLRRHPVPRVWRDSSSCTCSAPRRGRPPPEST